MPPFKDENILCIVPGSQTTLAQLGLPESFTPASHRFPTRVFAAPDGKTFEPYKVRSRKKKVDDVETDEMEEYEDPDDDEGAIWPLKGMLSPQLCGLAMGERESEVNYINRGSYRESPSILCFSTTCSLYIRSSITFTHHVNRTTMLDSQEP